MKRKVDLKIKLNFSPVASLAGLQRITTISGSCRMLVEILSLCFGQFCDDFFNSGVNLIFPSINLLVCVCQFILCNLSKSFSNGEWIPCYDLSQPKQIIHPWNISSILEYVSQFHQWHTAFKGFKSYKAWDRLCQDSGTLID